MSSGTFEVAEAGGRRSEVSKSDIGKGGRMKAERRNIGGGGVSSIAQLTAEK
jgi:hypothetical protein